MLVCDSFAAATTLLILILLKTENLALWHLYILNALNGLMNTLQQPASDVAVSLLTPREQYQRVSGLRAFSNSLVTVLTPVLATMVFSFAGIDAVLAFDLITFSAAFITLAWFITIPQAEADGNREESVLASAKEGLKYLKKNRGILNLILFLAAINLTASMYNAALPAMILSRNGGSRIALGMVNACTGVANLAGSLLVSFCHPPKSRVRVICNSLLIAMCTENFFLAFGRQPWVWCAGAILAWICIPFMNANMDVLFRSRIPLTMQGRVYSARNTLQFFTIPVGYLLGGLLVDRVFEPLMASQQPGNLLAVMFGTGKGSGAAALFCLLGILGVATCLVFRRDRHIWELEEPE